MRRYWKVFLTVINPFLNCAIYHRPAAAVEGNSSEHDEELQPLIFAWIEKPPYATPPSNGSLGRPGISQEILLRHALLQCGLYLRIRYEVSALKVDSEFGMIELLRQNKAHVALPIFEHPTNRRYSEFPFVKLDYYPGSEYITTEDDAQCCPIRSFRGLAIACWYYGHHSHCWYSHVGLGRYLVVCQLL